MQLRRPWDWHDPRLLGQEPGERNLGRRCVLALSNANREALPHQFAQLAHGAHQQPFVGIEIEMLPTSVCFKSPASVDEESLATERRAAVFVFPADWREGAALGRL